MMFKKYKIKRLFIRLITAAIILALIYFALILLGSLFSFSGSKNNQQLTKKEIREQKYNEPMIGSKKIEEEKIDDILKVIDIYYAYCNGKNYEKAYAMLSDVCKEVTYPTLKDFQKMVDKTFDKLKEKRYKSVINLDKQYIYKISLFDDVMAYGSSSFPTEKHYYIVINDNGDNQYTISLDGLIKKENLEYKVTTNNFQIIVNSKEVYYNKTTVNYELINNSNDIIAFNPDMTNIVMKEGNMVRKYTSNTVSFGDKNIYLMPNTKTQISTLFDVSNISDYEAIRIEYNDIRTVPYNFYEVNESEITQTQLEENYIKKFNMQIPL